MIKQFSAGDITVRPFGTFKHWTIQSMNTGGLDQYGYSTYYNGMIEVSRGQKITSIFYPTGSPYYNSAVEPVNPSGKYYRNVYSVANSMFYEFSNNPLMTFGVEKYTQDQVTGDAEVRDIKDNIVAVTLKHNVYGDTVSPNTIKIVDNSNVHESYCIYDDGYTNLYITGSHFPVTVQLGGVRDAVATPYWVTSSGQFFVTFSNGTTQQVGVKNAKYYMDMGLPVTYVPPTTGSNWAWDLSTARDYFQPNNEHFGESVSSWYSYVAVGSSMDQYSLSTSSIGYAAIFKYDPTESMHRLIKKINFPFTQSSSTSSYFQDSFGYSVAIRDNFLAVGSPTGSACSGAPYPGLVCVYDKYKGGIDNWGLINILKGDTAGDCFGHAVSIDNDILAVGAPKVIQATGEVYIFRKHRYMDSSDPCRSLPTASLWTQVITAADFCKELSSGSLTQNFSTPTFVSGNYTWVLEAKLTSSIQLPGDNFGWCLEVSDNKLLVGTNKLGKGYATLFVCSYHSASLNACPTASWSAVEMYQASPSYGDLDTSYPLFALDVSNIITTDGFGTSVAMDSGRIIVGCTADKAFTPYQGDAGNYILGAAYFYEYGFDTSCTTYPEIFKTFGNPKQLSNNNFGRRVAISGTTAAVSAWPDTISRTVDYIGNSYWLENFSYQSTGSEDSVLGRVSLYADSTGDGNWDLSGEIKRNKESGKPYNIYGYSLSLCSDFLCVGGPIVNTASLAHYSQIVNATNQLAFPSSYSGSTFVYELGKYRPDQLVGNAFYKNGYFVFTNTSSNYSSIMTGTGSLGFQLTYQGSHMIYEHEYLISLKPGEFNYSTNPTSLVNSPMVFDVNQDGEFDYDDVNLIMRYLQNKKFYQDFVFDDNGIIVEQSTLQGYQWWGNQLIQTEAEDVLQQESVEGPSTGSLTPFTRSIFNYIETNLVATGLLDIDGDGQITLNDGNILGLYYFNMLNATTLPQYLSPASTRVYTSDINSYLDQYCGNALFAVNPEFFGYQYSSSYDPTGSFLAPYITTVGLYDNNELVAVGKLGRPIKNLVDWPINIIVRFDT
jgi:hypothetical protein